MDLGAFAQIEDLEKIAKENGISCPRLRGYRLMRDEKPLKLTDDEIKKITIEVIENLVEKGWGQGGSFWHRNENKRKYLVSDPDSKFYFIDIRWDKISNKKRRMIKTRVRNEIRKYKKQYDTWNKYIGRNDILYIHSRIGGGNWPSYYTDVINKPWFIEKVNDAWDSTYCDIYAKIKPVESIGVANENS